MNKDFARRDVHATGVFTWWRPPGVSKRQDCGRAAGERHASNVSGVVRSGAACFCTDCVFAVPHVSMWLFVDQQPLQASSSATLRHIASVVVVAASQLLRTCRSKHAGAWALLRAHQPAHPCVAVTHRSAVPQLVMLRNKDLETNLGLKRECSLCRL